MRFFCLAVGGGSLKKIVVVLVYFTSVFLGKNLCKAYNRWGRRWLADIFSIGTALLNKAFGDEPSPFHFKFQAAFGA